MAAEKRIDILAGNKTAKNQPNGKNLQLIDVNSIKNKDVREIGAA